MDSAGWLAPLAVLGASALLGIGVYARGRGSASRMASASPAHAEASARVGAIYAELRALHATGGDAARVGALEIEAAELLWRLDQPRGEGAQGAPKVPAGEPAAAAGAATPATIGERFPRAVGAAWGAGVVALAGALWFGLQHDARPRAEGQGMTGGAPMESKGASDDAALEAARIAAAAAPADVEVQNRYAHALLAANKVMDGFKISEAVVKLAPEDAEARTHQAVVLLAIGDDATAAKVLDRVLDTRPDFVEALGYRGAIFLNSGDREKAVATWQKAKAADPAHAAEFDRLISMAAAAATPPGGGAVGGPVGGGGAPAAGAPSDAGASSAVELSGEVRLAAGAIAPPGAVLLVYVRAAGVERGPPARALRIAAPTFPVPFSISAADAPMGGTLAGSVVVSARLDTDGDPMTRGVGDLAGAGTAVSVGAVGIVVELR